VVPWWALFLSFCYWTSKHFNPTPIFLSCFSSMTPTHSFQSMPMNWYEWRGMSIFDCFFTQIISCVFIIICSVDIDTGLWEKKVTIRISLLNFHSRSGKFLYCDPLTSSNIAFAGKRNLTHHLSLTCLQKPLWKKWQKKFHIHGKYYFSCCERNCEAIHKIQYRILIC
jgi:hypothetical protein